MGSSAGISPVEISSGTLTRGPLLLQVWITTAVPFDKGERNYCFSSESLLQLCSTEDEFLPHFFYITSLAMLLI